MFQFCRPEGLYRRLDDRVPHSGTSCRYKGVTVRVIALLTAVMSAQAALAQEAELPTVVVAPIKQLSAFEGIAMLTEELRTQVARHGQYRLVTPEEIAAVDGELQRQLAGGCDDTSCVAEIGGALGAQFVITGQIGKLGRIYSLNLKLVDIETVAAKQAASARASSVEDFLGKMPAVVEDLLGESLRKKVKAKAQTKGQSFIGAGVATLNSLTGKVQRQFKRERSALRGSSARPSSNAAVAVGSSASPARPARSPGAVAPIPSSGSRFRQTDASVAVGPAPAGIGAARGLATLRKHTMSFVVSTTNIVSGRYEYRASPKIQMEFDLGIGSTVGLRLAFLGRLDRGGSFHGMAKIGGAINGWGAVSALTLTGAYRWVMRSGMTFGLGLGAGAAVTSFYAGPLAEAYVQIGKSF